MLGDTWSSNKVTAVGKRCAESLGHLYLLRGFVEFNIFVQEGQTNRIEDVAWQHCLENVARRFDWSQGKLLSDSTMEVHMSSGRVERKSTLKLCSDDFGNTSTRTANTVGPGADDVSNVCNESRCVTKSPISISDFRVGSDVQAAQPSENVLIRVSDLDRQGGNIRQDVVGHWA
jgi:hypothetical protein